jgi:hypothetical protein
MRRALLVALFAAPGIALGIAYGWGALLVYAFFAGVAFALAWGAGAVGDMAERGGRASGEGRLGRRKKD